MTPRMLIPHLFALLSLFWSTFALREFRSFSGRSSCAMAKDASYPFAYSKYLGQESESKGRVNSNLQDFRHECQSLGGKSKCHICEEIICNSDDGTCSLQLQGVQSRNMSVNIPTVSDTAWAVHGRHRHDYQGENVSHFCVFTNGGKCLLPETTDFSGCNIRCFGYGFISPARREHAMERSHVDLYPGLGRWADDGEIDLLQYPKSCAELYEADGRNCTYSGALFGAAAVTPDFNPQGFTLTLAGSGSAGFIDGTGTDALFNEPQDVAVDENGVVYVADTNNHAIRVVQTDGRVWTLTGRGSHHPGYTDGPCANATFTYPKGLDVRHEWLDGVYTTVIVVADTGNHRIRRVDYVQATGKCSVRCLTGLCGNNTLSAASSTTPATPLSGYADGIGGEARFSAPESVTFMEGDVLVVADTGNYLLRWVVASTGNTSTLAGSIVSGERDPDGNPLAGCTPPCMVGQQGFRDGNLSYSQFYNPLDVTCGPNNTVWVVDEQRVRIVELPGVTTNIHTILSMGRVSTIAGTSLQGHDDGLAHVANFFYTSGIFLTSDAIAYVVDKSTCRVRRITPLKDVAEMIDCDVRAYELLRPSGCTSFDMPLDKIGRKVSRVEANVQYNIGWPYESDLDRGKYIKNCVGVPPRDTLDKHFISVGDNLVVDDDRVDINEDSEQGTSLLVNCPAVCGTPEVLEGNVWYSESSSICAAARHDGKIFDRGGIVQIVMQRFDFLVTLHPEYINGTERNGLVSTDIPSDTMRVFNIEYFNVSNSMVHTVAGQPSAPLENGCGFQDSQPANNALFNGPAGIAARYNTSLHDGNFLYIADSLNHRIRILSAVCTQICENGGQCTAPDTCTCAEGWYGIDCTKPNCTSDCGSNSVCVAPETCACKPGFEGDDCATPQCVQECKNGGTCSAPDTCACTAGWFDMNCTTPVCEQTCANGGNCTSPNTCACPQEWTGADCRVPVCLQTCQNNGFCIAPNTCACPPQWTNYDCSSPVCDQGFFERHVFGTIEQSLFSVQAERMPIYKNCDLQSWCNATNEFECDQREMSYSVIRLPSGGAYRNITGRKESPNQCMYIELPNWYKIPFQLLLSDNTTTGDVRYSPVTPYTSNDANNWRGYLEPTPGHTGPWVYYADRQVAQVNWLNVTQGHYKCANNGKCISPGVCSCAEGWIGFDCRTPVCTQGFFEPEQSTYVSGLETEAEVSRFEVFMGNNTYRLYWPYSNPAYQQQFEYYIEPNITERKLYNFSSAQYFGPLEYETTSTSDHNGTATLQGGYRCSVREVSEWENRYFMFEHPNFYSRFMNTMQQQDGITYTYWEEMEWPPTHLKSRVLDKYQVDVPTSEVPMYNHSFAFTNEGFRRLGIWNRTENPWKFGVCILEFKRNCSDISKAYDIEGGKFEVLVQDTDIAYRPRIFYDDSKVYGPGRWKAEGGECVDHVIRGCFNNGTCVAPNTCQCATGWRGSNCSIPICEQTCNHNGNCTGPNQCTCERGWAGEDCSEPLCAQECQNGGKCVAPDVCQCLQWPNAFRDGRIAGGRPLYQDEDGTPLMSGWTGYDCATPICVQAERFVLNSHDEDSQTTMGGHGADALMECIGTLNGEDVTLPRCPQFDVYVTRTDGRSFQSGCGWDPWDTGCCFNTTSDQKVGVKCIFCDEFQTHSDNYTFYCENDPILASESQLKNFQDAYGNYQMCGRYHSPRNYDDSAQEDYGRAKYYRNLLYPYQSNFNFKANLTSNRFLCNVDKWTQGDYVDAAGLDDVMGMGSVWGLEEGRTIRINYPNIYSDVVAQTFTRGDKIRGEGLYECYNEGSCIAPDTCTCTDGYEGSDCNTPLCRHLQPTGAVSSCLNGGICVSKDVCVCVQTESVLWQVHEEADRGITGWTGTDCAMPMCVQGYYDPFCTDLPEAPSGEGCYRCANRGNCTAPDVCTCAEGWTGYDCNTPVCEVVADPLTRTQLGTVYEDKVIGFESDPCGVEPIHGIHGWNGKKYTRGNCTQPNQCTCLCKIPYSFKSCMKTGKLCDGPWQDPLYRVRNLVSARGAEFTFGSSDCSYGYEGNVDSYDRYTTCYQTVYLPSDTERSSLILIIVFSVLGFIFVISYQYVAARIRRRFLLNKIERRRSKRSSEESLLSADTGAFYTK